MKKLILLFLIMSLPLYAQELNTKYSYKDFLNQDLSHLDSSEFNDSIIRGSCFYQEAPYSPDALSPTPPDPRKDIFPDDLKNVVFEKCNLDNVLIKEEMTADNSNSTRLIRIQNDLEDWELGINFTPIRPIELKKFEELGISIDPIDIPEQKRNYPITCEKEDESRSISGK